MSGKRIKDIISFVTTGEMKDDSIGKDKETELSDVLQCLIISQKKSRFSSSKRF